MAEETGEELLPRGGVEEGAVGGGFDSEDDANGEHGQGADPHTDGADGALADGLLGYHADDIVEDEKEYRGDQRQSEAALADDAAEGCANEEEEEAGHGEGVFALPLDEVTVDVFAVGLLEIDLHAGVFGGGASSVEGEVADAARRGCGMHGGLVGGGLLDGGRRRVGIGVPRPERGGDLLPALHTPDGEGAVEAAHGGVELGDVHHLIASLEEVLAAAVEGERGDVEGDGLLIEADGGEGAPMVVLASGGLGVGVAVAEGEAEVAVVGRGGHDAAAGDDDGGLAHAVGVVVDDHVVEGAAVRVFAADSDDIALDVLVVFAGAYVDGGFLAGDVVEGHAVFEHGGGHHIVGKIEGHAREEQHDEGHGTHDAADGYAAGFHGNELVLLAEVAHGHNGGEEDGDGESHGDKGGRSIQEKFGNDIELEAFPNQVVDILPHELHEQHEDRDGESEHQRADERAEYEAIEFLHA